MAASHSSPESSASNLPFSIENILHGPSRKPIGSPQSAFRRVGKNVGLQPVFEELPEPVCIDKVEATGKCLCRHSHRCEFRVFCQSLMSHLTLTLTIVSTIDHSCVSSSHAEKWLEERYPHLLSGKRLKSRFTDRQVTELERVFRSKPYIMGTDRKTLAAQVGLSELQVKTWFQNKRQKYRRSNPQLEAPEHEHNNDAVNVSPGREVDAVHGDNGH